MRYVVTGATGFLGGVLARSLYADGHDVVALVRDPARAAGLERRGMALQRGDVTDAAAVRAALAGADGLFHVAGWYRVGSRDSSAAWVTNVEGTRTVLTVAGEVGTPRVVYTSTCAVNSDTGGQVVDESYRFAGQHLSVYDETKARAHDVALGLAGQGVPVVVAMPAMIYGPGDTSQTGALLGQLLASRRPLVPAGLALCPTFVDDVADGHVRALDRGRPGECYILAGPVSTLADFLSEAALMAGVPGPRVVPDRAVALAARLVRPLDRLPLPDSYRSEALRVATATYLGSAAKAQQELGWTSRPLGEGLTATIAGWSAT